MHLQRIQTYQDPHILSLLSQYAKEEKISLAEVLRRAAAAYAQKPQVKTIIKRKKTEKHPIFKLCGIIKGGPTDASINVDEIYDQDV